MNNDITEKKCNICHQVKPLTEFVKEKGFKDGYRPICKKCKNQRLKKYTEKWAKERLNANNTPSEKQCKDCLEVKPIDMFSKDKYQKDGKSHVCRECKSKRSTKMKQRWKNERIQIPDEKKCNTCHKVLSASKFSTNNNYKDGLDVICKDCRKKRAFEYKKRWKNERDKGLIRVVKKECPSCHKLLSASQFYQSDSHKDGLSYYCRECELKNQHRFANIWEKERKDKKAVYTSKKCNICNRVLSTSKFYKNRRLKNGISSTCIDCEKKRSIQYISRWKEDSSIDRAKISTKECIICHRVLPVSNFNNNKRRKDGLTSSCRECQKKRQEIYIEKWDDLRKDKTDTDFFTLFPGFEKTCLSCGRVLSVSDFYPKARSKDGLSSNCISCDRKMAVESRKRYLASGRWKDIIKNIPDEKECRRCHKVLPSSDFNLRKESRDGLSLYCKKCISIKNKEYRNNPETRDKLLKYWRDYNRRPETVKKNRKWARSYAKRPYVKKKRKAYMKEYYSRPDVQKRRKEYLQEYYKKPEVKERQRQYHLKNKDKLNKMQRDSYKRKKMEIVK